MGFVHIVFLENSLTLVQIDGVLMLKDSKKNNDQKRSLLGTLDRCRDHHLLLLTVI